MSPPVIIGLDLSGPANTKDTAAVVAESHGVALRVLDAGLGLGDADIVELARHHARRQPCVVAIDAPLSYNPGGGDRPGDKKLRAEITKRGLASGSVMTPTMTRMAYLTLRGVVVARMLRDVFPSVRIVEVHPGAAMILRGAAAQAVRGYATDTAARLELLRWLEAQPVTGLSEAVAGTSHELAAVAAALAGASWEAGSSPWCWPASPPTHPFDFAC